MTRLQREPERGALSNSLPGLPARNSLLLVRQCIYVALRECLGASLDSAAYTKEPRSLLRKGGGGRFTMTRND